MSKQKFGIENLAADPDELVSERRTVVIREIDFQPSEKFEDTYELLIYKDPINLETGEIITEFEYPDRINVKPTSDGKIRKNSMWGKWLNEFLPNVEIAGTDERGISFDNSPKELEGAVITEEQVTIEWGKDVDPSKKWIPVVYHGKYDELYK